MFAVTHARWCNDHQLIEDNDGSVQGFCQSEVYTGHVSVVLLVDEDTGGPRIDVYSDNTETTPADARALAAELLRVAAIVEGAT